MGKEWYWGGRSSSNSDKRGGGAETTTDNIPSGCMCAVFQAFDFHPFPFSINQQQSTFKSHIPADDHSSLPKGAEAPRNSLESEDGSTTVSTISKEENFKIPKNIRIKTSGGTRITRAGSFSDHSSEISGSPGTKTPTLVARLMGLDLLPDSHYSSTSSTSSSSSCLSTSNLQHHNNRPRQHIQIMKHRHSTDSNIGMRSLPETPARMSSARRSDVEHRLSLQINKENYIDNLEAPRFSFSKRNKYDENSNISRSPSHYARQIVKQVKESVSRKVGLDITNTVKNREQQGKDQEFVAQFKLKKTPKTSVKSIDESSPGKHSNPSHSPRLSRFIDTKQNKASPISTPKPPSPTPPLVNIEAQVSRVSTKPKPQALAEKELLQNQESSPKCKKSTGQSGKLSSRLNKPPQTSIRNKQEESFIIRPPSTNDTKTKSKRTHPLSTNLLNNLNTVPNLLPIKTDPSPPATKIPQKQVSDGVQEAKRSTQLFRCSRQTYNKQEATHTLATRGRTNNNDEDKSNGAFTASTGADNDEGPEYQYITAILSRTGMQRAKAPHHLNFQWFSSIHPLDPSLFHRLELYPSPNSLTSFPNNDKDINFARKNHLGPRCNRRLLFDLVDEVLSDILVVRPKYCYRGSLLETVWERVRSFPRAKCEVLEDIDGLVEMEDTREEEEEGERLVAEIEGKILETLVHETITVMVGGV